jgi:hypothetical protein
MSTTDCYVYMIGHKHAIFGHAIKVGISNSPGSRLATLQTGCIDELELLFAMRFATRDLAFEVERLFHESGLAGHVRGEWVGCDPVEALFYLSCITAEVLSRRYHGADIGLVRNYSRLQEAFDVIDRVPDELQSEWNNRLSMWNDHLEERGYH